VNMLGILASDLLDRDARDALSRNRLVINYVKDIKTQRPFSILHP